uniref:N-acetyltransferase domain-containing protein n=1 Tax=Xenopsylla cheopis TaxID=163159 RepID=A0A6M2DLN8_XENCH
MLRTFTRQLSNLAVYKWRRPESVQFPIIWRQFERQDKKENRLRKFRISDVSDADKGLQNALVKHMCDFYLKDEPLFLAMNMRDDSKSVQETEQLWHNIFSQRLVLACLEEAQDGNLVTTSDGVPRVVGCNFTFVTKKGQPKIQPDGKCFKIFRDANDYLASFTDCYAHYGVDEYLYAFGLSVDPSYRGMGVAMEILKARNDMGRKVGLKATVTTFTALESQKLAEKCGYETLVEKSYEQMEKDNPAFKFPGIQTKTAKLMGMKL